MHILTKETTLLVKVFQFTFLHALRIQIKSDKPSKMLTFAFVVFGTPDISVTTSSIKYQLRCKQYDLSL